MALRAEEIGLGAHCVRVLAAEGDPAAMMATPAELESTLQALAKRAVVEHGAEAIVIDGGPLGRVAKALSGKVGQSRLPTSSAHTQRAARRIIDPRSGDVWIWPAEQATHAEGAERLWVPTTRSLGRATYSSCSPLGDLTFLKRCILVKVCYPHPS